MQIQKFVGRLPYSHYQEIVVERYPYREARIGGHVARIERAHMHAIEYLLAAVTGGMVDNHVVYGLWDRQAGRMMYYMFSDDHVTIGTALIPWERSEPVQVRETVCWDSVTAE